MHRSNLNKSLPKWWYTGTPKCRHFWPIIHRLQQLVWDRQLTHLYHKDWLIITYYNEAGRLKSSFLFDQTKPPNLPCELLIVRVVVKCSSSSMKIQWNPQMQTLLWPRKSVLIRELSWFQGHNSIALGQSKVSWSNKMSISGCPHFSGYPLCITTTLQCKNAPPMHTFMRSNSLQLLPQYGHIIGLFFLCPCVPTPCHAKPEEQNCIGTRFWQLRATKVYSKTSQHTRLSG